MASADDSSDGEYRQEDADKEFLPSDYESSSEGERIDYTESEDESEAEFTSDEEPTGKRKKRSGQKKKKHRFIEMEAEVGDEDDDELEDDDEFTRQFIADEDELKQAREEAAGEDEEDDHGVNLERYRALSQRQAADDIDFEAEERRLKSLYGKALKTKRPPSSTVPSQFLLPTVTDPKLWLVRCKLGKERAAVHQLLRSMLDSHYSGSPSQLFSAIALDALKGYVYIEAHKPAHVAEAIERARITHWLFAGGSTGARIALVPLNEMTDVLKFTQAVKASVGEVSMPDLGSFVRVKRGKYAQDLAHVVEVPEEFDIDNLGSVHVKIKILPRINYRAEAVRSQSTADRPLPRPFDQHEAAKHGSVTKSRGYWIYAGETYKDGYLFKDVRLSSLLADNVAPLVAEVEKLGLSAESIPESQQPVRPSVGHKLAVGDRVVVQSGDFKNMTGTVDSLEDVGLVRLVVDSATITTPVTVPLKSVNRHFRLGDSVRVVTGEYSGVSGMVVDIDKRQASIYTDAGQQVSVAKADLQLSTATESSSSRTCRKAQSFRASAKFSIFDLVQMGSALGDFGVVVHVLDDEDAVQICDMNGHMRKEAIDQVFKIVVARNPPAGDLREGDRVVDESGLAKVVVAVYRGMAFLRKSEGGGDVQVTQAAHLTLHKLPQQLVHGSDPSQQRPSAPRFSAGPAAHGLVGKSVRIIGGPYKGYIGIAKELVGPNARVELHTNSKIVTVERDRLEVAGDSNGPIRGPASAASAPGSLNSGKTPALGHGRTPAWSTGTGKTPAWGAGIGKTPTWGASAATPTWKASTGKTPTWQQPVGAAPASTTTHTSHPPAPVHTWAIANAQVVCGADQFRITRIDGLDVAMSAISDPSITRRAVLSDLAPAVPSKKDRVAIHAQTPVVYGSVIGLDGCDAVIKVDGSGEFKIVNIASLVKMAQ